MPAGAGQPPKLPAIDAETLVQQVLTAQPNAFGGTVTADNKLGLPAISEIPQLADGKHSARIWTDGNGKLRLALPNGQSEQTIVDDGRTTWSWNSQDNEVTKSEHQEDKAPAKPDEAKSIDPATTAKEIVNLTKEFERHHRRRHREGRGPRRLRAGADAEAVREDVAEGGPVAVDSELRIPLRVYVLTNGTSDPSAQIGFASSTSARRTRSCSSSRRRRVQR